MDTETMIRELERVEEKHKHDKVFTGQLDVAKMAYDTRKRLEELKPYEDIGLDPNEIQELKERNTPKKVRYQNRHGEGYDYKNEDYYHCPSCGRRLRNKKHDPVCPRCAQLLDWKIDDERDTF